jgi:hypothetical protein
LAKKATSFVVFLDINNMPGEIMLQWKDANGWEHRAYWDANNINLGIDGKINRRYMGPLPKAGFYSKKDHAASDRDHPGIASI